MIPKHSSEGQGTSEVQDTSVEDQAAPPESSENLYGSSGTSSEVQDTFSEVQDVYLEVQGISAHVQEARHI